jgi:uncharacterized cupin superfamily protein
VTGHPAIIRWETIEDAEWTYPQDVEPMGRDADYTRHFGFQRLGIHHVRLLPGRRTSFPHAESAEDEFVYVIAGHPDVWLDGHLHRLSPGDAVGLPAGTGLAHSFLNNTEAEVRLIVVGDRPRDENRVLYPTRPDRKPLRKDWWEDAPPRERGPHDGVPDARRKDLPETD